MPALRLLPALWPVESPAPIVPVPPVQPMAVLVADDPYALLRASLHDYMLTPRAALPEFVGKCRRCAHSLLREDAFCPSCGLQVDYGAYVR